MKEYASSLTVKNPDNLQAVSKFGTERRLILGFREKADGSRLTFATKSAFTKTAIQLLLNDVDIQDRLYPTQEISAMEIARSENVIAKDDYGTEFFQRYGSLTRKGKGYGWTNKYCANLGSFNNQGDKLCAFPVFSNGAILYMTDAETELEVNPVPIKSFMVMDGELIDGVHFGNISWAYDLEGEENKLLRVLCPEDLDFNPLSFKDIYSLNDVTLTVTTPTTAGATVLAYVFGDTDIPVRGLAKTDLVLTDDAGGSETITDLVATSTPGQYAATWTLGVDGYLLTGRKDKYSFNTATFSVSA